ncbi:MAG: N-formylglutamate amidohydrolase [Bacteroidota bacterium]
MTKVFEVVPATAPVVPILLSVPHCGTFFPEDVKDGFKPELIAKPDDTDWFVHQLYDFAPALGITMVYANVSRWVIDLNRDPQSKPLYNDGRVITALCPTTDFLGQPIYRDERTTVGDSEVQRRLDLYYHPYYRELQQQLDSLFARFGKVLLWDCHSIRQHVPSIREEKFPDLILGDADGASASEGLISKTLGVLQRSNYTLSHNHPFKGGYITRSFGKPLQNHHALQLEMTKVNYMDDAETGYDEKRAGNIRNVLKEVFRELIQCLHENE